MKKIVKYNKILIPNSSTTEKKKKVMVDQKYRYTRANKNVEEEREAAEKES